MSTPTELLISLCKEAIESCKGTDIFYTSVINPLLCNDVKTIEEFRRTSVEDIKCFRTIGDEKMKIIYKMRELLGLENPQIVDRVVRERIKWNYISKVGPPPKDKYDWVLVKTDYLDGAALPHIAEFRADKWYATDIGSGSIEDVLGCTVIAWADIQLIK